MFHALFLQNAHFIQVIFHVVWVFRGHSLMGDNKKAFIEIEIQEIQSVFAYFNR